MRLSHGLSHCRSLLLNEETLMLAQGSSGAFLLVLLLFHNRDSQAKQCQVWSGPWTKSYSEGVWEVENGRSPIIDLCQKSQLATVSGRTNVMNGTVAASRVSIVSFLVNQPLRSLVAVSGSIGMGLCFYCSSIVLRPLPRRRSPAIWVLSRDWRSEERIIDSSTVLLSGPIFVFLIF